MGTTKQVHMQSLSQKFHVIKKTNEAYRRFHMSRRGVSISGKNFLKIAAFALVAGSTFLAGVVTSLAAGTANLDRNKNRHSVKAAPGIIRVASVSTAVEGGILPALVESFRAETGLKVIVSTSDDPYTSARKGMCDLVISHFGHRDTESFVLKSFGLWPRTVFSNQLALFGPPSDPAKVRGMTDLVQAFRKIAQAKAPYVVNETRGIQYFTEILWQAAGKPPKGSWFIEHGGSKSEAIAFAASHGGYVLWGITPFIRGQNVQPRDLEPLVTADPLLQRIMVSVVINPQRIPGTNAPGALKFQEYLLLPSTQARMLEVHYPGTTQAVWAPAGRNKAGSALPDFN